MYRYRLLLPALLAGAVLACLGTRPPLIFSPSELPKARIGQPYQVTITVSNNETPVFSMGIAEEELPPGLTLYYEGDADTASFEGTPVEAGEYEFTLYAYCYGTNVSGQTGEQQYKLLVQQE